MRPLLKSLAPAFLALLLVGAPMQLWATIQVSLAPSLASPQPVGTPVDWVASASDTNPGTLVYRYSFGPSGGALAIVRDFSYAKNFTWVESVQEGTYQVQVTVKNLSTHETATSNASFVIAPRATPSLPVVVTPTANPLVALYSTTVCPVGYSVAVAFQALGSPVTQYTPPRTCTGTTLNTYIAGMRANTFYVMTSCIYAGGVFWPITIGVGFMTGTPSGVSFPTTAVISPPPAGSEIRPVLLHSYIGTGYVETATDLAGNVIWYYGTTDHAYTTRVEAGGKMLMVFFGSNDPYQQPLKEIDLAGNTLLETNAGAIADQLVALGAQPISSIHHEIRRLANGNFLLLGSVERMTPGVQGGADVLGDEIVILDPNLQVIWYWNAFDHLDVNRAAILGEMCTNLAPGCPPVKLATVANDWLHSNAVDMGSDGNIIISLRHQDWIAKIDYANGTGTGAVLWRLGANGDFTINSSDPSPWFSHAHDAHWELGTTQYLSLFDNGNTRHAADPAAHSRGQLLSIDETNHTASLVLNFDLGLYSAAVGTAQMLWDGNVIGVHYEAGAVNGGPLSQSITFYPSGIFELQSASTTYRSFQLKDLYRPN